MWLSYYGRLFMSRNLVLFLDGTANKFGETNTNVVRTLQSLVRDDGNQLVYYDPGVGTMPGPGLVTRTGKLISKLIDLAFATGLDQNVTEAYTYLINNYEPDDKVYLFGFSRGSYTARVVAALLNHVGLLPRGCENLIPYALRLLRVARKDNRNTGDQFRRTFARLIDGSPDRRFPVHFVGVFDTVSSVGWFWEPAKFKYTAFNPGISIIRHAIALDERRAFYRQNRFSRVTETNQDFQQLWFAGVHSDVGGGYPDTTLGRCSLNWMLDEAKNAGLHIDEARRAEVAPAGGAPWLDKKHNSMKPGWWPCEILVPKVHWNDEKKRKGLRVNFFRSRKLRDGEMLHESLLLRLHDDPTYKPANISQEFREYVRGLSSITEPSPYWKTKAAPIAPPKPLPST